MYHTAGIKYSYVAHLRDTGTVSCFPDSFDRGVQLTKNLLKYGFSLPSKSIKPVGQETTKMVEYLSEFILNRTKSQHFFRSFLCSSFSLCKLFSREDVNTPIFRPSMPPLFLLWFGPVSIAGQGLQNMPPFHTISLLLPLSFLPIISGFTSMDGFPIT